MANFDENLDHLSQLPYPNNPQMDVVGCLLDVSGSMKGALEAGLPEQPAVERLQAALRAISRVARAEQRQHPDVLIFVGLFGLDSDKNPGCPTQIDLCSVIEALIGDPSDDLSGHDLLVGLAKENNGAHVERYIRTRLSDDQARFIYVHLQQDDQELRMNQFLDTIISDKTGPGNIVRRVVTPASKIVPVLGVAAALVLGRPDTLLQNPRLMGPLDEPSTPRRIDPSSSTAPTVTSRETSGSDPGEIAGRWVDKYVHSKLDAVVDNSEAMRLAHSICNTWLAGFTNFVPRSVTDAVNLLTRLQEKIDGFNDSRPHDAPGKTDFLGALRRYLYGKTPMKHCLEEALNVFREYDQTSDRKHVLLLVSDGMSTDGDPLEVSGNEAQRRESNVTIATVFLTRNQNAAPRRIYDQPLSDWGADGRTTLFNMSSKVSLATHPIPVLTTLGWEIPSSGEGALFAAVCSVTALEEFCSIMVSARFEAADELLDVLGRWNQDKIIKNKQKATRDDPSDQFKEPTCYAHAAAAVIYMALHRIVGREEGYPTISEIRDNILLEFPPPPSKSGTSSKSGASPKWKSSDFLAALKWDRTSNAPSQGATYCPLQLKEVDKDGARQAVLRRRPVLTTFNLSDDGWDAFGEHLTKRETRKTTIEHRHMDEHRDKPPSDVGHAVVLIGCSPTSLTFLNSWGRSRGDKGVFSISEPAVLETTDPPSKMRFYDMFWYEEDLTDTERAAYNAEVDEFLRSSSKQYPSIISLEAQCPACNQQAPIARYTGSIREAVCPNCSARFEPKSDHIRRAL